MGCPGGRSSTCSMAGSAASTAAERRVDGHGQGRARAVRHGRCGVRPAEPRSCRAWRRPDRCGVPRRTLVTGWLRHIPLTGPCGAPSRTLVTGWLRHIPNRTRTPPTSGRTPRSPARSTPRSVPRKQPRTIAAAAVTSMPARLRNPIGSGSRRYPPRDNPVAINRPLRRTPSDTGDRLATPHPPHWTLRRTQSDTADRLSAPRPRVAGSRRAGGARCWPGRPTLCVPGGGRPRS